MYENRTRSRCIEAAIKHVVQHGSDSFKTEETAKALGLKARTGLYRHFKEPKGASLEQKILAAALAEAWEAVQSIVHDTLARYGAEHRQADPRRFVSDVLQDLIRGFLGCFHVGNDAKLARLIFVIVYYKNPAHMLDERVRELNQLLDDILAEGQKAGAFLTSVPVSALREAIVGAFLELIYMLEMSKRIAGQEQALVAYSVADILFTMQQVMQGFATPGTRFDWSSRKREGAD